MTLEKKTVILPTHNCFDDTKNYIISEFTRKHITFLSLCHGLCIKDGKPFSHAWIMNQEIILDFGLVDEKIHILKYKRSQFFEKLNVQWFREYKLSEAIAAEHITQNAGPWDNELRAMCRNSTGPIHNEREKLANLFGKIWRLK